MHPLPSPPPHPTAQTCRPAAATLLHTSVPASVIASSRRLYPPADTPSTTQAASQSLHAFVSIRIPPSTTVMHMQALRPSPLQPASAMGPLGSAMTVAPLQLTTDNTATMMEAISRLVQRLRVVLRRSSFRGPRAPFSVPVSRCPCVPFSVRGPPAAASGPQGRFEFSLVGRR